MCPKYDYAALCQLILGFNGTYLKIQDYSPTGNPVF